MKCQSTNKSSNLAYAINTIRTVTVKKGQYNEGERCQKTEVRRQKTKKKEDMISEDKRDNI